MKTPTSGPRKTEYPPKKRKNVVALFRICHGQIQKAAIQEIYTPRLMLMNLGSRILVSAPQGIALAPRFEAKTDNMKPRETMAMPARAPAFHCVVRMRLQRDQGFQASVPQAELMEEVAKIPSVAQRVLPTTRAISWDRTGAEGVRA